MVSINSQGQTVPLLPTTHTWQKSSSYLVFPHFEEFLEKLLASSLASLDYLVLPSHLTLRPVDSFTKEVNSTSCLETDQGKL